MIENLRLQHFRSYNDTTFEFGDKVNIIVGPNAIGKTNLIEAILVVARGSSYRVADSELLRHGQEWFRLDGGLAGGETRVVKLQTSPRLVKSYEINHKPYKRLLANHTIPVVLFEPNHLQLLHGAPDARRQYLDDLLEQTIPAYASFRRNYKRVLSQRNSLLKRARTPTTQELFPWDIRLGELGAVIARERSKLVEQLSQAVTATYKVLSGTDTMVTLRYKHYFPIETYESNLLHKLTSHLDADSARGFTTFGPHREDFEVYFNDSPAELVASRGETRTVILGLKIAELQLLTALRDTPPLLLLDDVFSELDGARRQALTKYLKNYQTFLTTTDADVVIQHFMSHATIIPIQDQED